jgi:two-component system sensor histidine kinase CiaH
MFKSAALKLTGWYLAIIMLLSIGTSIALYNVSSNDLKRNIGRQITFFSEVLNPADFHDYSKLRQRQLTQDLNHLKANLVIFNVVVLAAGGAVSYALARRTLEPIEDALKAQTRFTADASHELRTPLTAMQAEIEVALRNSTLTKAQATEVIKSNLEEVERLKSLSEGLLLLAQTSGKLPVNAVSSLGDIVKEATARLEKTANAKKVKLQNSAKNLKIKGEKNSLTELLVILIDNAIKYSPQGSKVHIGSKKDGKTVQLSVKDEGIGIKNTDLPRIFERFYRADSSRSSNKASGYGLGLAIAKKIAQANNGSIEVKSAPGKGSTFTIFLHGA